MGCSGAGLILGKIELVMWDTTDCEQAFFQDFKSGSVTDKLGAG